MPGRMWRNRNLARVAGLTGKYIGTTVPQKAEDTEIPRDPATPSCTWTFSRPRAGAPGEGRKRCPGRGAGGNPRVCPRVNEEPRPLRMVGWWSATKRDGDFRTRHDSESLENIPRSRRARHQSPRTGCFRSYGVSRAGQSTGRKGEWWWPGAGGWAVVGGRGWGKLLTRQGILGRLGGPVC